MGAKTTLRWDEATLDAMRQAVRAAYPAEACGFLLGKGDHVRCLHVARNIAQDPRQAYEAAPEDLLAAMRAADARDLDVLGVFHSHPDGAARLSATDLALAQRGWLYVVVATRGPEPFDIAVHAL